MLELLIIAVIFLLLALITEVSASALKLTGLDIHTSRFQALSALTGTGFTTRETELIMQHKNRRYIIMFLMVIGPIGFIAILSTVLLTTKRYLALPQMLTLLLLTLIIFRLTRSKKLMVFLHRIIEKQLKKRHYPRRIVLDEVLELGKECGVVEIKIDKNSIYKDKTLEQTGIKSKGYIVLAIERNGKFITVPKASDKVLVEDVLVVFGNIAHLKSLVL
ncbi:MAG: TrkA C-terminal domain-containing protein [Candidatus Omnitrophica bacterium]|nr:TrkA C-terminal domain-containing protein [Candidatus Omnitrophota bacterium]